MSERPFAELRDLVDAALDKSPTEREDFVKSSLAGDEAAIAQALAWLRAALRAETRVGTPSGMPPAVAGLPAGTWLGDFEVILELGRGQQAVVYKARQRSLGRLVALKVLERGLLAPDADVDRFQREAEAAGRLNHSNVVTVYGYFEVDGHQLLAEELVEGQTLDAAIKAREGAAESTRVDARWAADICRQLAEGLQHAHEHGVVHRDVKPTNVLMTSQGLPKLGDFGLARVADLASLSLTGTLVGTPSYMSPEQVDTRARSVDGRSDVYSLGAVLYRLLTGVVPFQAKSLHALFNDILTRAARPVRNLRPEIDRDLEAVCMRCLEKSPDDRYANAGALAEDLARYLSGRTTVVRPVGLLRTAHRQVSRLAASTLAVAVLLIPALWFALDATVLEPAAVGHVDASRHVPRFAGIALATLLTLWPATVLARRLAGGRAWAAALAALLVLAPGAWAALAARELQLDHRQFLDREALTSRLGSIDRRGTDEIDAYVAAWQDRFTPTDLQLVARGFLLAKRAPRAREWVTRLDHVARDNPISLALDFALEDVFGTPTSAAALEARLWAAADRNTAWSTWVAVGQILRDVRRPDLARRAYELARRDLDAPLNRLRPSLAQVSLDLCQFEQARQDLAETLAAPPADVPTQREMHRIACRTAIGQQRWDEAAEHRRAYAALPGADRIVELDLQFDGLANLREAGAMVRDLAAQPGVSNLELAWCGSKAVLTPGIASLEEARDWMEFMSDCYERVLATEPDHISGLVGLAAARIHLANPQLGADAETRTSLLDAADQLAARAIELDDSYFQAWANQAVARLNRATLTHGDSAFDTMPIEELDGIIAPMRTALERDALEVQNLNDFAQALVYLHKRTGDAAPLAEALAACGRAIKLSRPAEGSACGPDQYLGYMYDTQRDLFELAGDDASALESARASVEITISDKRQAGADLLPKWKGHVERLEAELAAGR